MKISNMSKKPLAAFARFSYVYLNQGFPDTGEVLSDNVFFYGNTQNWKGVVTDIGEYFTLIRDYRLAFVPVEQIPKFTFPTDDPKLPAEYFDEFILDWYLYDFDVGKWYRVETENPFVYSQRGLRHYEYNIYSTTDLPNIITDRFDEGAPIPSPALVDSFENNVTELNIITPLVLDYLEN